MVAEMLFSSAVHLACSVLFNLIYLYLFDPVV